MDFASILTSISALIVAIGILVTIHEFGHFWVARKLGVKVLRFSVGFGKPLWKKKLGEDQVEYVLACIPLGGYVKMLDEREGDVAEDELDRAFNRKSVWRRFAIVAAGPIFNFIFAVVAYYLIFLMGIPGIKPIIGEITNPSPAYSAEILSGDRILEVNGIKTQTWNKAHSTLFESAVGHDSITLKVEGEDLQIREKVIDISELALLKEENVDLIKVLGLSIWRPDVQPTIREVIAGGAADIAGVMVGDKVLSLDGEPIKNMQQWQKLLRDNPNNTLMLKVLRDGQQQQLEITPQMRTDKGQSYGFIGVTNQAEIPESIREEMSVTERYGPIDALLESIQKTARTSWLTLKVFGQLVVGEASIKNLSGPITIAQYAGISAGIGLDQYLIFLAVFSISIGVLNLLPVPMLDGGHLMFYIVEILKGSAVSEKTQLIGQNIGMLLLIVLMSIVMSNDILRLVG